MRGQDRCGKDCSSHYRTERLEVGNLTGRDEQVCNRDSRERRLDLERTPFCRMSIRCLMKSD